MADALPAHSKLGASSYARWKACPGSVRLSQGVEKQESEYAKEGTAAHMVAERMIRGERAPKYIEVSDSTFEVDGDMLDAVKVYVSYVSSHAKPAWQHWNERKFHLKEYHPDLFGTSDHILYNPKDKHLVVVDYKHGQGIAVEASYDGIPNSQLMYYGLGALHVLKIPIKTVDLVIVQPRCFHPDGPIRKVSVSPLELVDFAADLISDAKETENPNAKLSAGSHCRFCPAAHKCPEIKNISAVAVKSPFSNLQPGFDFQYDPAELSQALNQLDTMESYIKAVREFAYREAAQGRCPPGFKLVAKRANRKWNHEDGALKFVTDILGVDVDLVTSTKFKSVAQLEKVVSTAAFERLQPFITQESSGQTLVPISDNRIPATRDVSPFNQLTD